MTGILALSNGFVKTYGQLLAVRSFVGLVKAGFVPGEKTTSPDLSELPTYTFLRFDLSSFHVLQTI